MKRLSCGIILFAIILNCHALALAEEDILTIAVMTASDAMNLPAEEAFFKRYPNAVIEYHLYTEEQLNTMLIAGTIEFDLAILPYQTMLNMAKKGYLASVEQVLEKDGYPDQLIDLSDLLTIEGWVFALPVSIAQQFWIWDADIATQAGVSMPEADAWTWADYAECAKEFPKDTDDDGKADTYLMYGSCLPAYPAFRNVNLNMFTQYAAQYTDFEMFAEQYLDLFRENITGDALLDMASDTDAASQVLIQEASASNPIDILDNSAADEQSDSITISQADEQSGYRFLTPPLLDKNNVSYVGSMSVCGVLKQAKRADLAAAFLQGMVLEDALDYGTFAANEQLVSREAPEYMYFDENGSFAPNFTNQDNALVYRISAGRNIPIISFVYSQTAFAKSQDFRAKLSIDTFLMGRDFYDSAWSYFQEWYYGRIDDAELIRNMQYLFGIAGGIR